jgi:hypothetical protein
MEAEILCTENKSYPVLWILIGPRFSGNTCILYSRTLCMHYVITWFLIMNSLGLWEFCISFHQIR